MVFIMAVGGDLRARFGSPKRKKPTRLKKKKVLESSGGTIPRKTRDLTQKHFSSEKCPNFWSPTAQQNRAVGSGAGLGTLADARWGP